MRALSPVTVLFSSLLCCACGGAPEALSVLQAPEGVERWEPSGAVAIGEQLWVVNDKDGHIAAYALPLKPGVNTASAGHKIDYTRMDPVRTALLSGHLSEAKAKEMAKRLKFEGAAPSGEKGMLLLEAISRSVWRCPEPEKGCPELRPVDTAAANDAMDKKLPEPVTYLSLEGLAAHGERVWVGSRGFMPKGKDGDAYRPWPVIGTAEGELAWDGSPQTRGGKAYGLGAMVADEGGLWLSFSHERETDPRKSGVAGLLARATIDPATGLPGAPTQCRDLPGKPEGLARWGEWLIVVFDNDRARKGKGDPTRFQLGHDQDYALMLKASEACKP